MSETRGRTLEQIDHVFKNDSSEEEATRRMTIQHGSAVGHIRLAVRDSSTKKSQVRLDSRQSLEGGYFERI